MLAGQRTAFFAVAVASMALCSFLEAFAQGAPAVPSNDAVLVDKALVSLGDTARLQHALAKARRGEDIVIGAIGGSITAGARASKPELAWPSLVAQWWRDTFPKASVKFVNAGIGATGSDIGAHRVRAHLLKESPDVVMVEYAVNDPREPIAAETLEGLARQILTRPNKPAVMLLFTMDKQGGNAQQFHEVVGRHYGLPMASFRDALWPEIEAKRIAWTDIEADDVHPNDRGHAYCARFLTNICATVLKNLPSDDALPQCPPLPDPCGKNAFENATFLNADAITPSSNDGWKVFEDPGFSAFFGKGWKCSTPGGTLTFDVEGTVVSLIFYRIKGQMGIAEAQVDDKPPVKMDAWFSADWGGYTPFQLVARDLSPGRHVLRVKLLDEKNAESSGHEFRIHAVLTSTGNQ